MTATDKRPELPELLPCPFCGHVGVDVIEGSTFRWRIAQCAGCGAQTGEVRHNTLADGKVAAEEASRQAAIAEWNTRSPEFQAMRRDAARWREARRRYLTANHEAAIDAAMREGGDG